MKKVLSLLLMATAIASSCSKSSNKPTPIKTTPTVLLTKVIDNITGDANIGQPLYEFTYNGKQLTQAVLYHYSVTPDVETDVFNYNAQGQLTGTTITHTQANSYNDVSSTVTYQGSTIADIKFYLSGNVLDKDVTITYTNGSLTNWFNSNEVSDTYTYDASGHQTKELAAEYQGGKADGYQNTVTNSTFDTQSNLSNAVPFWIYFRVYVEDQSLTYTTGTNNPLNSVDGTTSFSYSYQYNSYGYPSSITWNDQYPQSYLYQYTQAN